MSSSRRRTHQVTAPAQRRALTSPLRLEILGLFSSSRTLSVGEMAERMGRPSASLYYHVHLLERVGILLRAGTRGEGRRAEVLYRPVADRIELPTDPQSGEGVEAAAKTLASAFRMAERDFAAAMQSDQLRRRGPHRNLYASRLHLRVEKHTLRELNEHLRALEQLLLEACSHEEIPDASAQYLSLTIALLPLRGRDSS